MIQLDGSLVTCFASFNMIAASCCHQPRHLSDTEVDRSVLMPPPATRLAR